MQSVPASEWITRVDEVRERALGALGIRNTVEAPPDFLAYPKDYKRCVCCGEQSTKMLSLDGRNYYCPTKACQAQRVKRARALRVCIA